MIKIKKFHDYNHQPTHDGENSVNEFIKDKEVVDIKFQYVRGCNHYLVIYKENEEWK